MRHGVPRRPATEPVLFSVAAFHKEKCTSQHAAIAGRDVESAQPSLGGQTRWYGHTADVRTVACRDGLCGKDKLEIGFTVRPEIGRASCRERGEIEVGETATKESKRRR